MAKRKYFRHGNPEHYTYFNNEVWENMTEEQKKNWVPADEVEDHPVAAEITDFMNKPSVNPNDDLGEPKDNGLVKSLKAKIKELEEKIKDLESQTGNKPTEESNDLSFDPTDRNFLKEELTKLGVDFDKRLSTKRLAAKYEEIIKSNTNADT